MTLIFSNSTNQPSYVFLDLQLPAYTPYPYPPTLLPIQDVWPPDSGENSLRNYTYPRGSVQLVRGVTSDFDTEGVGGALDDAEGREENAINEKDDRARLNGSNESNPKDSPEKNEETIGGEAKVFRTPDSLLPPQRTESLVYLQKIQKRISYCEI